LRSQPFLDGDLLAEEVPQKRPHNGDLLGEEVAVLRLFLLVFEVTTVFKRRPPRRGGPAKKAS